MRKNNCKMERLKMKRVLFVLFALSLIAGCGKIEDEKNFTGYLTARISHRNLALMFSPMAESTLQYEKKQLAEYNLDPEELVYKKKRIKELEDTIILRKLIENETPEQAKKAVYIQMMAVYANIPPEVQKEFLNMASDNELWEKGNMLAMMKYPNASKFIDSDATEQKVAVYVEKLGLRLIAWRVYYDSPDALNKAYESVKKQ